MGDSKRWTVTYTKHIKQKRKLYQDGFLRLQISTNKLLLYDECDKLLACRLLKNDETVISGETLEFNGYVVDIGDPEGHGHDKPQSHLKFAIKQKREGTKISAAKANIMQTRKPLSPSQQVIKEFKKRELLKYGSPQISPEITKPSTLEFPVLYTTQVTQKAKKYHDGFLQLAISGSHGGQIKLFDASRKFLDSRFLKKDDVIRPGESIAFDAYLIDIGEPQENYKPDCKVQRDSCAKVERVEKMDRQHSPLDTDTDVAVGKSEWQVLYTTQINKKSKKYHDGLLQLEFCGSHGRQVVLYDSIKRPLERRFLKKDEVIKAGESVSFDGHLVDVGEPVGRQSPVKLNEQGTDNAVVQRRILTHGQNGSLKANPSVYKGEPPRNPCIEQEAALNSLFPRIEEIKSSSIVPPVKPLRDANQILSFLQMPRERSGIGGRSPHTSCHNIKSSETMKSLDATFPKVVGGFGLTENAKLSHQPYSDKEAQQNVNEVHGDNSCVITDESNIAEEISSRRETFPSFDLGF